MSDFPLYKKVKDKTHHTEFKIMESGYALFVKMGKEDGRIMSASHGIMFYDNLNYFDDVPIVKDSFEKNYLILEKKVISFIKGKYHDHLQEKQNVR